MNTDKKYVGYPCSSVARIVFFPRVLSLELLVLDHLLNPFEAALDFFGGVLNLVGVIEHTRRQEDDQLGTGPAPALRAEYGAKQRNTVKQGDARRVVDVGLPD